MGYYQSQSVQANVWPDRVLAETRNEINGIATYLDNVVDDLTSFSHVFNNGFDVNKTYELLDKHLPDGPIKGQKEELIDDIIRLATLFTATTKSGVINLQLQIVSTDMCRLFHVDYYRQRLLCTYLGPGTEWLDHSNVEYNALGKGDNKNIVKDENAINRANRFDVLILKGKNFGDGDLAVVHRSPPIIRHKKTRILLKIDEEEV